MRICPNPTSFSINYCSYIGNKPLKYGGKFKLHLKLDILKNLFTHRDQGIIYLFHSTGHFFFIKDEANEIKKVVKSLYILLL